MNRRLAVACLAAASSRLVLAAAAAKTFKVRVGFSGDELPNVKAAMARALQSLPEVEVVAHDQLSDYDIEVISLRASDVVGRVKGVAISIAAVTREVGGQLAFHQLVTCSMEEVKQVCESAVAAFDAAEPYGLLARKRRR